MVKFKFKRKEQFTFRNAPHYLKKQHIQNMCYEWNADLNLINCIQDEVQAGSSYKLQPALRSS